MRSVAISLVMLLAFVLSSNSADAQCFSSAAKIRSGSLGLFGASNVVVAQPVVQSFVAQPFVAQQLVVPQSTSFFSGNVAFLNAPAAVVGHQAFVVQQQRVRNQRQRQGIFGNLFNNNRQQRVIVHQPRVQNVVVGHSRLLIR